MSLIKLLRKQNRKILFTTPSHNQGRGLFSKFSQIYKYDVSETNAYNPQEALKLVEKRACEIYKTKQTKFLINGSTSGIVASTLACVKSGEKVLVWKDAHKSHKNAVKLANGEIVYYEMEKDKNSGLELPLNLDNLENRLKDNNIKALILTSPTYEGVVSDVKSIKKICEKYKTYLIVDEAHGALYPFSDKLPESSIKYADFTVQSLHKTAGGLNPTALLHCNCDLDIEEALEIISTTSPSYPLLATIEANINYINSKKGRKKLDDLIENIKILKKNCVNCEFFGDDETKIVVKINGLTGLELSEKLYDDFNIEDEKTNEISTMLLCGIGTDLKKLKKLELALKKISK